MRGIGGLWVLGVVRIDLAYVIVVQPSFAVFNEPRDIRCVGIRPKNEVSLSILGNDCISDTQTVD